jgi:hypothetical protein
MPVPFTLFKCFNFGIAVSDFVLAALCLNDSRTKSNITLFLRGHFHDISHV